MNITVQQSRLVAMAQRTDNVKALEHFTEKGWIAPQSKPMTVTDMKKETLKAWTNRIETSTGCDKRITIACGITCYYGDYSCTIKPRKGMLNANHTAFNFYLNGKRIKASDIK